MSVDHHESNVTTTLTRRSAALQDQPDTFIVRHHLSHTLTQTLTLLDSGHYPMPMGPGGGYGHFPPPLPPPRMSRGGPRSIASSKGSSYSAGPRMPYRGAPYGYPPNMYYGYPPYAVSNMYYCPSSTVWLLEYDSIGYSAFRVT